ncbi:nucleotidyltransferase [bacterium]|nr:nucleotidyltransferase [bacterium]
MIQKNLLNILDKILKIALKAHVSVMFMGGIAVSVWGEPRTTYDIDAVIGISSSESGKFLLEASKQSFTYDKRNPVKTIQKSAFITLASSVKNRRIYVDLFLASGEYQRTALSRRKEIKLSGRKIPIISAEDLVLYKLLAGRGKDIDDIREILISQKGKLDMKYMKKWANKLGIMTFLNDELDSTKSLGKNQEKS